MRGLFINDMGACSCAPIKRKEIAPAVLAAIIGAGAQVASTVGSSIASSNLNADNRDFSREMTQQQNEFNSLEAEKARQHQSELLTREQDWNEQMYNLYNSPSAMMRQYKEAGLNPYLVDAQPSHGQSMSSPSSSSSPQAVGGSYGSPNTYVPDLTGIGRAGEMALQAMGISANAANQNAQAFNQVLDNAIKMKQLNMSDDDIHNYLYRELKSARGSDFDASRFIRSFDLDIKSKEIANDRSNLAFELDKYYSPKERQSILDETDQLISESVARIGKMASDAKLNEAKIKQLAQDCVESLSRIYRNTAEGSLAEVQGLNIMTLLPYLESSAQFQGEKEEFDSETTYGNPSIRKFSKSRFGKALNIFLYYLGRGMNAGNIGVNVGAKVGK